MRCRSQKALENQTKIYTADTTSLNRSTRRVVEYTYKADKALNIIAEEVVLRKGGEAKPNSRRAEMLAERIEQGANSLAAFVEELTEAEWRKPVTETDRRTVGVIVYHVAAVYPIEVDLAKAIAAGNAVMDVTWDVVAQLNAKHAEEQDDITKDEALGLLWQNSREAADAVRKFTEEELDNAAPFGLTYGAPVTAQFVIEDHALRHSWHHLARIRKAVGR